MARWIKWHVDGGRTQGIRWVAGVLGGNEGSDAGVSRRWKAAGVLAGGRFAGGGRISDWSGRRLEAGRLVHEFDLVLGDTSDRRVVLV